MSELEIERFFDMPKVADLTIKQTRKELNRNIYKKNDKFKGFSLLRYLDFDKNNGKLPEINDYYVEKYLNNKQLLMKSNLKKYFKKKTEFLRLLELLYERKLLNKENEFRQSYQCHFKPEDDEYKLCGYKRFNIIVKFVSNDIDRNCIRITIRQSIFYDKEIVDKLIYNESGGIKARLTHTEEHFKKGVLLEFMYNRNEIVSHMEGMKKYQNTLELCLNYRQDCRIKGMNTDTIIDIVRQMKLADLVNKHYYIILGTESYASAGIMKYYKELGFTIYERFFDKHYRMKCKMSKFLDINTYQFYSNKGTIFVNDMESVNNIKDKIKSMKSELYESIMDKIFLELNN